MFNGTLADLQIKYEIIFLLIALKNWIFEFVDIVLTSPALHGLSIRHEDTEETACIRNELGVRPQGYDLAEVILLQLPYVIRGGETLVSDDNALMKSCLRANLETCIRPLSWKDMFSRTDSVMISWAMAVCF